MKKRRPSRRWDRHGVSEIIANLLILGITVTLFSSVLMFVTQMPAPKQEVYTDFSATTEIQPVTGNCWINVTNQGGQVLSDFRTKIYILKDDQAPLALKLSDSLVPLGSTGSTWDTGEMWIYRLTGVTTSTRLSIMVIDYVSNSMVWSSVLRGEGGGFPPVIGERGIIPTPSYAGDSIKFYASVMDPDGNLRTNSVFVNAISIGISSPIRLTDQNNTGIFESTRFTASYDWNGKIVLVNATDKTNKESTARMTLNVQRLQEGGGGGGSGEPPGNIAYSGLQGFSIFLKEEWEEVRYDAPPREIFESGQVAVVVVASKYLVNTQTTNSLLVMNGTTKQIQTDVSSPKNIFIPYEVNSGYYVYTIEIDTNLLLPIRSDFYHLDATLRDSWVPNNVFQMNARIYVHVGAIPSSTYPTFVTYSDSTFTSQSNDFTTYDPSSNVIYVEVRTKSGGTWVDNKGVVEIRDFFWNAELRSTPYTPTGTYPTYKDKDIINWIDGVSNVWQAAVNKYRFAINLYEVYDTAPWIAGKNAYILKYDMFQAGTETYVLSKVVSITAPNTKLDIVAGGEPQGQARWSYQGSLYFYKNDNLWSPPWVLESTTDKLAYNPTVYRVKAGDVNGDSKTDFVAIMKEDVKSPKSTTMGIYAYLQNSVGNFDKYLIKTLTVVDGVQLGLGNTGLGNTLDIVIGYPSGLVELYKNDGAWTSIVIDSANTKAVSALQVANMAAPGTVYADLNRSMDVIIGRADGTMTVYKNQNGVGTSWSQINLLPTSTTNTQDFANGESLNSPYIFSGTYIDTTSAIQLPYVFEELKEIPNYRYQNTNPTAKGPVDNCTDFVTQLTPGGPDPYTVLGLRSASMIEWDGTNLIDDVTTKNVTFEVRYRTNGANNGLDWITWRTTGAPNTMIHITDTAGDWTTARYDLTTNFPLASVLRNLNVTYHNTNPSSTSVDFMYWSLNVTWVTGDKLDHNYTLSIPSTGTSYTFSMYALRELGSDDDVIRVSYSINGGVSYKAFPTDIVILAVGSFDQYTSVIPVGDVTAAAGNIRIKVEASTVKSASPGFPHAKIGQMMVTSYGVLATSVGTTIKGVVIDDMNGDKWNDIVALGYTGTDGKIVVFQNTAGNSIFESANAKVIGSIPAGMIGIGTGKIFNPYSKNYKDIAYASSSTIYFINQTSLGTYAKVTGFTISPGYTLVKVMVVDVEGNGRADILLAGTDRIAYYSNYLGYAGMTVGTRAAWEMYYVDSSLVGSGGFIDMDCRKFQTY